MKSNIFSAIVVLIGCGLMYSQEVQTEQLEEVVLTESRFEVPRKKASKVITLIDSEDIENNRGKTLVQLLNEQIGININGSLSQAGQNLNTFIRGGQNRQVLVMINGLPVNDPSLIESNFDLQSVALDQIESIEIIRGASSALFGNRASTAVVNIELKGAESDGWNLNLGSNFSTDNDQHSDDLDVESISNFVNLSKGGKDYGIVAMFSNTYTDGLSAIQSAPGEAENESDLFTRINTTLNAYFTPSKKLKLEFLGTHAKYRTDYDTSFGFIDGDNRAENEQLRVGMRTSFKYKGGDLSLNSAYNTVNREFDSDFPAVFKSNDLALDLFNRYKPTENLQLLSGLSFNYNSMDSETVPFGESEFSPEIVSRTANVTNLDPYVHLSLDQGKFRLNGGIRLNVNSEYGIAWVYNINPSYTMEFDRSRIKYLASLSSAYITPSLYQLFAPGFGNADLNPQSDTSFELGTVYYFEQDLELSVQYFRREQQDQIDYVVTDFETFEGEYQNLEGLRKVQGVEVGFKAQIFNQLAFRSNYSYTESLDGPIFRIPKHKLNASLNYSFTHNGAIGLSYQFNSARISPFLNEDFTENIVLDRFELFNLDARYILIKNKLVVNAGIFNLFNEDYEELYRFSTRGRNYQLGFSLNL